MNEHAPARNFIIKKHNVELRVVLEKGHVKVLPVKQSGQQFHMHNTIARTQQLLCSIHIQMAARDANLDVQVIQFFSEANWTVTEENLTTETP